MLDDDHRVFSGTSTLRFPQRRCQHPVDVLGVANLTFGGHIAN